MKKHYLFILIVMGILIFGSCATTYQYVYLPDQDKKLEDSSLVGIYVMRPAFLGTAISMQVKENDSLIGSTGPKSFLCWETTPEEKILLSKSENTSKITIPAEKGNVYYVHQHVLMGMLYARNSLELINDEQRGQKLLSKCKPPVVKTDKK